MKKTMVIFGLLAVLGFVISGCSSSVDPVETGTTLEDFGSFKPTDESPNFDDADIAELTTEAEEVEVADPAALSPIVTAVENADVPEIYTMRVVWGNLERDSGVTDLTDWSGTLTLSRGAVIVKRTIRFEPGQDYLLPRYDSLGIIHPEVLNYVSKTSWHFDGLRLNLYIPPSVTDEVVTLTYESENLSMTFNIDELEDLDTLISIGFGNAISFQSISYDPTVSTRGSLAGRWGRDDEGNGIFYGKWIGAHGNLMGTLKGEWGTDEEGNQVFAGKYIDINGQFEGLIKGVWAIRGVGHNAAGHFKGRIYNSELEPIGMLKGHFKRGNNCKSGYFAGRWCVGCPNFSTDETL
ncbi:MAG: hypothetical protein KAR42_16590 [candidate division Zixibacteria bacterium]|nr:hypothetical protein [candidate division Zixibacteria bacterium]